MSDAHAATTPAINAAAEPQRKPERSSPRAQQARLAHVYARRRGRRVPWWVPLSIVAIWALALTVATLLPKTYRTSWSLILPISSASSTVSLDSIGQSTVQPGQPFSNVTLSPKVIYREILGSERLAADAARRLGMARDDFGRVRVRSVDETALLNLEISGRSAEETLAKAKALNAAFADKLDQLRSDEAERRAQTVRESLKRYEATLGDVRQRITQFQRETGFLSSNQFSDAAQAVEIARRKTTELTADIKKIAEERAALTRQLGLSADDAATALKIAADPSVQALVRTYSETNATIRENEQRYGTRHPSIAIATSKRAGVIQELKAIASTQGVIGHSDAKLIGFAVVASQQSELMRGLVQSDIQLGGRRAELEAVKSELARLERDAQRLSVDATRFEGLKKDLLVAEAVYTSAAARLDTNRSDVFASYPLVQHLSQPELPKGPQRLHMIFAIAAASVGTLFILFAWGLSWAATYFGRRRSKSASSI
jgi:uncharacterized protein involved in exopolysaccharide biosynthesis